MPATPGGTWIGIENEACPLLETVVEIVEGEGRETLCPSLSVFPMVSARAGCTEE
jgi:hypothetical protein